MNMNSPDKSQPACRIETKEEFLARTSGKAPGYGRESGGEHGTEAGVTMSRRKLLFALGGLAVVAAGITGYKLLETDPIGGELMSEYEKLATPEARHMYVLKQVAAGNMPSSSTDFVTIEVKGRKGKVLKFKVAPHGLRIGHDDDYIEVPLDGPHALAACEIQGYTLPTKWMSEKVRAQAFKTNGKVRFVAEPEIKKAQGEQSTANERQDVLFWRRKGPDGTEMMSPRFVETRNMILKKWREDHKIDDNQLTSGYFKEIVQDSAQVGKGYLATYPGYSEVTEGGRHRLYFFTPIGMKLNITTTPILSDVRIPNWRLMVKL